MQNPPTPESVFATLAECPGAVWLDGGATWTFDLGLGAYRRSSEEMWISAKPRVHCLPPPRAFPADHRRHHLRCRPPCRGCPLRGPYPRAQGVVGEIRPRRCVGGWSLDDLRGWAPTPPRAPPALPPPAPANTTSRSFDEAWYVERVDRIRALIADGDCYQVNLSRRVEVEGVTDPFSVYRRLRSNDAGYGAYLVLDKDTHILSNSPELLLERRKNGAAAATRSKAPAPAARHP